MTPLEIRATKAELLLAIQKAVMEGVNHLPPYPGFVVPPFAELLVLLSQEADETARKMERLTRYLYWATIALLVVTVLLLAKEIVGNHS